MLEKAPVWWSGDNLWRPSVANRVTCVVTAVLVVVATVWISRDPLSAKDTVAFVAGDVFALVLLLVVPFRWRMVLEHDELIFVFLRVRRLPLRGIVDATCVAKRGLVFVSADGSEESFGGLGNSVRGHRRKTPTRSDLIARTVLCAAARARGETPPVDFRLGPIAGLRRAAVEGGIFAFVLGLFLGN